MGIQLPEGMPEGMPEGDMNPSLPAGLEQGEQGYSELDCLKDVIDDFPRLLTELKDPVDVQDATKAMLILVGIQRRLMQPQQGQSGSQTY